MAGLSGHGNESQAQQENDGANGELNGAEGNFPVIKVKRRNRER